MVNHLEKIFIDTSNGSDLYFVSDVHGCLKMLLRSLEDLGFKFPLISNPEKVSDKLIFLGDMIDRGESGYELLQTIRYNPSMIALRGNHEVMALEGLTKTRSYYAHWLVNGGSWNENHDEFMVLDALKWANSLPDAIEVNVNNEHLFGMTHAGLPMGKTWEEFKQNLNASGDLDKRQKQKLHEDIMWEKDVSRDGSAHHVDGVDATLHGHTIHDGNVHAVQNRVYIDTGCGFSGADGHFGLTILHYKVGGTIMGLFDAYKFTKDPWGDGVEMQKL